VKLKDVCTFYTGTGFPTKYQGRERGKYPFYKVGDISKNAQAGNKYLQLCDNFVDDEDVVAIKGNIIPSNTIVFAKIGEAVKLNRRAITETSCLVDNNVMGIAPDESEMSLDYFYYFMRNLKMETLAESTTVPSVRKSRLEELKIQVPTLDIQEIICKKLNSTERIMVKRRQQLEELDMLIKARFVEMFGDPIQNEKNWSRRSLEQLCHSIVDCPHSTPNYISEDTGFMCIRTSVVKKNKILWDEIEYIVEDEFNQRIQRKRPEKGDIVYTREGAILGIAAIIDRNCNVALGQRSMLLSPDSSVCTSEFICTAMNSDSFLSNALRGISGSASPHINVGDIKSFEMIAPPLELQRKFSEFNSQVDKLKVEVQKSLDEMQILFDSLMQEYFG